MISDKSSSNYLRLHLLTALSLQQRRQRQPFGSQPPETRANSPATFPPNLKAGKHSKLCRRVQVSLLIPGLSSGRCLIFELEEKQSLRRRMSDLNRLLAFSSSLLRCPFCFIDVIIFLSFLSWRVSRRHRPFGGGFMTMVTQLFFVPR
jgi:hypothetical protein